jgi:RimJ/RimL family protein N-acetyltransferase
MTGGIAAQAISTGRLILVPLAVEYAAEMAGVLADPVLYKFTGGTAPGQGELRARYERWVAGSPDPDVSWCNWVIRLGDRGPLTGTVQATICTGDEPRAEVAWVVGARWQGQGIATEAARALVGWLTQQRPVPRVIAHIHPGNHASAAVAAAAGLTPTSHLQDGEVRWQLEAREPAERPWSAEPPPCT